MVWPPNQMSLSASAPEAQLGNQHGSRVVQALHHHGILRGHTIAIWFGAVGSGNSGGIQQIFSAPWDAVQRAAIMSRGDLAIGLLGLRQGKIARKSDDAAQFGIEAIQPVKVQVGEPLGSELACFDPARKVGERSEGDVHVVGGKRDGRARGADEAIAIGAGVKAGQFRIPARGGRYGRRRRKLARSRAALVNRRHRLTPVARGGFALGRAEFELHQLFGFGESGSGNRWSDLRRGAERRRGAGRKHRRARRMFC